MLKAKEAEMNLTHMLICNHKCSQTVPGPRKDADMELQCAGLLTILGPGLECGAYI